MSNSEKETVPLSNWVKDNSSVFIKLLFFTAALFVLPIGTFYYTLNTIFEGNTTYAAGSAVVVANVIVALYIIAAMLEDNTSIKEKKSE